MFTRKISAPIFYLCIIILLLWHAVAYATPHYGRYTSAIHAYEVIIDSQGKIQSGCLLHSYKSGERMHFTCNMSETQPHVLLRYKTPSGGVYDFVPTISLKDGSVEYGPYGEAEMNKEKRRNFHRVF